jgi:hypothetical protein
MKLNFKDVEIIGEERILILNLVVDLKKRKLRIPPPENEKLEVVEKV